VRIYEGATIRITAKSGDDCIRANRKSSTGGRQQVFYSEIGIGSRPAQSDHAGLDSLSDRDKKWARIALRRMEVVPTETQVASRPSVHLNNSFYAKTEYADYLSSAGFSRVSLNCTSSEKIRQAEAIVLQELDAKCMREK